MVTLFLLSACDPSPGGTLTLACDTQAWFRDADGDGFGVTGEPWSPTEGDCAPPAGWAAEPGDCDDDDDATFPGATPTCGGSADNDCDGAPDAIGLDADEDGRSSCAGDCDDLDPAVGPRVREVCNNVDDDCDGLLDQEDDSVDLFSCGFCPDPAAFEATFDRRSYKLNPCVLDPTVTLCRDGVTSIDTLHDGDRLHEVSWPKQEWGRRPELLLFIPPGPGNITEDIQKWGIYTGYRTIVVGFPNDGVMRDNCRYEEDRTCYAQINRERLFGDAVSTYVSVEPNDSLVGRLTTLLKWLAVEHPSEGWEAYLDGDDIVWNKVIAAGWSEGGTLAASLGQQHELAGEFLIAPGVNAYDLPEGGYVLDDWWNLPSATPPERIFGLYSAFDPQALDGGNAFNDVFGSLGLPPPATNIDNLQPPYDDGHVFRTFRLEFDDPIFCTTHGAVAMDKCMDEDVLMPAYFHVYCTLPLIPGR